MKNLKLFSCLLIIVSTTFLAGCVKDNGDYEVTTKQLITGSAWSIDYYFSGQDKTAQFNQYKLNFTGTGTVTADNGTSSFNGNWSMITDLNRKDVLRITLSEAHLQDLNSQWTVENVTTTGVLLLKNSGGELRLRKW